MKLKKLLNHSTLIVLLVFLIPAVVSAQVENGAVSAKSIPDSTGTETSLTGSLSRTILTRQDLLDKDEQNIAAALQGKVPNLEVMKISGDAGTGTFLRFRGTRSILQSNQPLFVVDGIPFNNSMNGAYKGGIEVQNRAIDLNIHDIASVEFLPGASVAALYGSRGANGVVLITTRSGTKGKPKIRFSSRIGTNSIPGSYPLQRSFGQGRYGAFEQDNRYSWGESLEGVETFDHFGELTDTGMQADNNLSISGGFNRGSYYFSAARFSETGPWKAGSDYRRNSFRFKGDLSVLDNLKITGGITHMESDGSFLQRGSNSGGLLMSSLRTPPEFNNLPYLDPETNLHRSYRYSEPALLRESRRYDNPFFIMHEHKNSVGVLRNFGFGKIEYRPLEWIKLSYLAGYDDSQDTRTTIFPESSALSGGIGAIRIRNYAFEEKEGTFLTEIDPKKILSRINFDFTGKILLGHTWNERRGNNWFISADNLIDRLSPGLPSGYNRFYEDNHVITKVNTESYFGSIDLKFWDQLYVNAGLRGDASSLFADKDRFFWYPRIGGDWEISKLDFVRNIPKLDFAVLHSAWGSAGIEPEPYSYTTGLNYPTYHSYHGNNIGPEYYGYTIIATPYQMENRDARPEQVSEIEFGTAISLLNSRIAFDITFYRSKTEYTAMIENRPYSSGYITALVNKAEIENKGIELTFNATPFKSKDIIWNIGAVIGKNDNKITSLGGIDKNGDYIVGKSINSIIDNDLRRFGRGENLGNYNNQHDVFIDNLYPNAEAGKLYIHDDGYPTVSNQEHWLGDYDYNWQGGISSTVSFRENLKISALFNFRTGGKILNGTKGTLYNYGLHSDTMNRGSSFEFDGYGPGAGMTVTLDESYYRSEGGYNFAKGEFLENADFLKLRELSVSYLLNNDVIRKMRLESILIRLSARNLITWTKYTGFDPETSVYQDGRLLDYYNHPQTRSFSFSFNLNY